MTEPRIIGERYRIERALQLGPLAQTYLAHDLEHDRPVVLKQLSLHGHGARGEAGEAGEAGEILARYKLLEREAKILRNLEHPGIPTFIDTFRAEEQDKTSIWLVQEYRAGRTLRDMVEDGWHGSAEDIVDILCKVAEILSYLHSRVPPIVHRDVKPANIIVGPDQSVSLVDLGAACTRVIEDRRGSTIVGTPGYVPMEQFVGQAVAASDVYALGMVGVYLITHEEPLALMREDGTVHYRHLATLEHPTLLPTIDRMIASTLDRRPRNAQAVLACLRGAGDPGATQPDQSVKPTDRRTRPRRAWVKPLAQAAGLAVLLAGAVGGTYAYMASTRTAGPAADAADADQTLVAVAWGHDMDDAPEPSIYWPGDDLRRIMSTPEPARPPAAPPPGCRVMLETAGKPSEDATELACTTMPVVVEPMIVEPGRIRMVLDNLDSVLGDAPEPTVHGWLEDAGTRLYWVVDATIDGYEMLGPVGCPEESEAAAASLDHQGRVHLACLNYEQDAHLVVFDSKRKNAWIRGSFPMGTSARIDDYMGYIGDQPSLSLAVPERGPALLVYQGYNEITGDRETVRVQPLARGSTSFDLFPRELSEIGEWVLYSESGQIHAVVRARRGGEDVRGLHKVAVTTLGSRMAGALPLVESDDGDVFCHRVTTAHARGALLLRSPNEFGDQTLVADLEGAYALPGPDTAPATTHLCGNSTSVFVKVGAEEAHLRHEDTASAHKLACRGRACLMAHRDSIHDLVVTRFTLP